MMGRVQRDLILLGLIGVVLALLSSCSTVTADSSILSYGLSQAKVPASGLINVSPNCRVTGKPSSLAVSREKKNGIVSFRPKLNRPCSATFQFATEIKPELIQSIELTFRYRGPTSGVTLSGPKRSVTVNGISFVAQQNFEVVGDGHTFERFYFDFDAIPRETAAAPLGAQSLEYLFKNTQTLEIELSRDASREKAILEFDELHLNVSYYVPSPMVTVNKVAAVLSTFKDSIKQGKSTVLSSTSFDQVDARIGDLWEQNVGTTTITGGVVRTLGNAVLVVGTTQLSSGATAAITQGIVTNCDARVCSITAISKICFTAQNYQASVIKAYVGPQFASLASTWFDAFAPDFSLPNCVYFATGDTVFEGLTLRAGFNLFLNGDNSIFDSVFLGKGISITGLIGLYCGDACTPSQEFDISTPEIGTLVTTSGLTLKSLALVIRDITSLPIEFGVSGVINLKGQDVTLSGSYVFGGPITVTVSLPGLCWSNPFGIASFLRLCEITGTLVFNPSTPKFFVSAAISSKAYTSFPPFIPTTGTLLINVDGGIAVILNDLPFGGAISAAVSAANPSIALPSELNEITAAIPTIQTLAISTFDTGAPYDVLSGFTLILPVKVTGNFADTLKSIFPDPTAIQLSLKLRISSSGFLIALELSDITIYAGMKVVDTSLSLTVQSAAPPTLAIQTGIQVQLASNPSPLVFLVIGTFSGKSITIGGAMIGDWVNPFGIKGFTLGDVALEAGFGPPVPPAIIRFGITAKMIIGTKFIRFAGLVDLQQPQQMFLYGNFSGADGQAFTLLDIIQLALTVANKASGRTYTWDLSGVPINWGLSNIFFKIAPSDASIATVEFKKGFEVSAGIRILGIVLQIGIRTYDLVLPGLPFPIPDFNFNFLLDATEFNAMFYDALENVIESILPSTLVTNDPLSGTILSALPVWPPAGMSFSQPVFALQYVSIENFGFFNFFAGTQKPKFRAAVVVRGVTFSVETEVTLFALFGDLSTLFTASILDELGLPQCITNAECGGSLPPKCSHLQSRWTCVNSCPGSSIDLPGIGCVPCTTNLDCILAGQTTCNNGMCS